MMSDDLNFELPFFIEPPEAPLRFDVEFIQALDGRRAEQWRARQANIREDLRESEFLVVAFSWKD